MGLKVSDVYSTVNTKKNVFYSAYLKNKVQFNDVDPDKVMVVSPQIEELKEDDVAIEEPEEYIIIDEERKEEQTNIIENITPKEETTENITPKEEITENIIQSELPDIENNSTVIEEEIHLIETQLSDDSNCEPLAEPKEEPKEEPEDFV